MPRKGITQKQVAEVMVELKSAGVADPSLRLIRNKLGSGSLTSIMRHKQALEAIAEKAGEERLPDALTLSIKKASRALWIELAQAADEIVKEKQEALDRQQKTIDKKIQVIDVDEAVMRSKVIDREKQINSLQKQLRTSENKRLAMEKKLAKISGEQTSLTAFKSALAQEKRAHQQLRKQVDKERAGWLKRLDQLQTKYEKVMVTAGNRARKSKSTAST